MRAIEYGVFFGLFSTAAFYSASPKPYVFQGKAEFAAAYTQNVEQGQPLNLTVGDYSNGLMTLGLGAAALYSLVRMVSKMDDKPIIQQPQNAQPVTITNTNNVIVKQPQQSRPTRSMDDFDRVDESGDWINKMLTNGKRQHYKIDGVTQSGKTTFAEHLLSIMSADAEKLLVDPKYRKGKPNWSIPPYCTDIDKVPTALDHFAKEIVDRQQSEDDYGAMSPLIFVIDEWDWIYTEYGKNAVTKLRKLIKVGAELGCYVVLIGQSPLSTDSGLSTSDFDQLVRISIGKSAIKVLGNAAQFPFKNRDELLAKAEQLFTSGQRFALVQEHGVTPRLEIIPEIIKPVQDNVIQLKKRA